VYKKTTANLSSSHNISESVVMFDVFKVFAIQVINKLNNGA